MAAFAIALCVQGAIILPGGLIMAAIEELPRLSPAAVAAQIRSRAQLMKEAGSPLYASIVSRIPDDSELLEISSRGLGLAPEVHLLVAVHYLLMQDPRDPLAQYYASLTETPAPPEDVFPDFKRYCLLNRQEILRLLETRTIQLTTVSRCQAIMALLSHVADGAGEPLNLIEVGCSAGLLLAFDKFAYDLKGRPRLGAKDAPITLSVDVHGGPDLRIPRIDKRIGIDLRPVDVRLEDERRWMLAQHPPEAREEREKLVIALEKVAGTDIEFFEGDALDLLPEIIVDGTGPLCVFHSACVCYWSDEGKGKLESLLLKASRRREIWRASMEPDLARAAREGRATLVDFIVTRYCDGAADSNVVIRAAVDNLTLTWTENG